MSDWSWEKLLFEKEQEIAKLEKRLEWISVDDRLPALEHYIEDDMPTWAAPYVVTLTRLSAEYGEYGISYYLPDSEKWLDSRDTEDEPIRVDYWMPLPDPPTEPTQSPEDTP